MDPDTLTNPRPSNILDRLDVYYRRVLKDKLGVDSPLLAIPPELRPSSDRKIGHFFLGTLANLALHDDDLASFRRRLSAEVAKNPGSGKRDNPLVPDHVMSAINTLLDEQDALRVLPDAARDVQQDTDGSDFVPDISSPTTSRGRSSPTPPKGSDRSRRLPRRRKHVHLPSSSPEVHQPRKKLSTRNRRGADTSDHWIFFTPTKDQHFKNPNPTIIRNIADITDVNALAYPVEVAIPRCRGEFREIANAEEMKEFLNEFRECWDLTTTTNPRSGTDAQFPASTNVDDDIITVNPQGTCLYDGNSPTPTPADPSPAVPQHSSSSDCSPIPRFRRTQDAANTNRPRVTFTPPVTRSHAARRPRARILASSSPSPPAPRPLTGSILSLRQTPDPERQPSGRDQTPTPFARPLGARRPPARTPMSNANLSSPAPRSLTGSVLSLRQTPDPEPRFPRRDHMPTPHIRPHAVSGPLAHTPTRSTAPTNCPPSDHESDYLARGRQTQDAKRPALAVGSGRLVEGAGVSRQPISSRTSWEPEPEEVVWEE